MFLNAYNKPAVFFGLLLSIGFITTVECVNNDWLYKRSNSTVTQAPRYQQQFSQNHLQRQRSNQTFVHSLNNNYQLQNNRGHYNQSNYKPGNPNTQLASYGQRAFNQTNPTRQQSVAQNRNYLQNQQQGQQANFNQTRPSWQQPQASNAALYPVYGQKHGILNQTRTSTIKHPQNSFGTFNQTLPQPSTPIYYPQYPTNGQQHPLRHNYTALPQPSAPQLPNNRAQSFYSNNKTASTWSSPSANQTNLYPALPQPASANGYIHSPSAQQMPQDPTNWQSGNPSLLSYGPGHYPLPAGNSNRNPPSRQGSSNPYANIFN